MKNTAFFVRLLALAALMVGFAAAAETWPARPIRFLVPYPPGGPLDTAVRPLAVRLGEKLGQPVVVENQPGAGGNIGLGACARAKPDGYTFCATTNDAISFNPSLYEKMPLDPAKDLVPVQRLVWIDALIVASSAKGIKSFPDLVNAGKKPDAPLMWGSWGTGSAAHLYSSEIGPKKQVNLLHVPYKGASPLLQALLTGEVDATMLASGFLAQHIKSGKVIPLAAATDARIAAFPSLPTVQELGITLVPVWFGLFAPTGTPEAVVQRVNAVTAEILSTPNFTSEILVANGLRSAATSTVDFRKFLVGDRANGDRLVKLSGARLD